MQSITTRGTTRRTFISATAALAAGMGGCAAPGAMARGADVTPGVPPIPGLPLARPEDVGMSSDKLRRINEVIAGYMDSNVLTGAVTAVARRNQLVHFRTHGHMDIVARRPMQHDAEFYMMSSTKPVMAVALLQQIEAGRVSLSDPISKFIPELGKMRVIKASVPASERTPAKVYAADQLEPQAREITIRDLATHTSGLNRRIKFNPGESMETYIKRMKDSPLDFQPGTKWAYSAVTAPDVLVRVVEVASGQPFGTYLRQRVLDPVGMRDTTYLPSAEQQARIAKILELQDGRWTSPVWPVDVVTPTYTPGGYGLYGTARDYLLFETMLLNKGTVNGRQVLKPESVALMRSSLIGKLYEEADRNRPANDFGVMVRVIRDEAACNCGRGTGAFGWHGYFGTVSWTDPANELVAVFMIQQRSTKMADAQRDFERAVRAAIVA